MRTTITLTRQYHDFTLAFAKAAAIGGGYHPAALVEVLQEKGYGKNLCLEEPSEEEMFSLLNAAWARSCARVHPNDPGPQALTMTWSPGVSRVCWGTAYGNTVTLRYNGGRVVQAEFVYDLSSKLLDKRLAAVFPVAKNYLYIDGLQQWVEGWEVFRTTGSFPQF